MAIEWQTVPTDPIVGMPHPLLIFDADPDETWDYDHMFFPERLLMKQGLGGVAVRRCYGQHIPKRIHKIKNRLFDEVELPETDEERFRTVVKGFTGVVSRWAIDLRQVADGADDPLVYMDDEVFARTTDRLSMYHQHARRVRGDRHVRRDVGRFMMDYALRADIPSIVSGSIIDEFLDSRDPARRQELGNWIINRAMLARLDPIAPEVSHFRRLGLVQEGRPTVRQLPGRLIPRLVRQNYHDMLARQLMAV